MNCESCKYVFHAEDGCVNEIDKRLLRQRRLYTTVAVFCPRCGYYNLVSHFWDMQAVRDEIEQTRAVEARRLSEGQIAAMIRDQLALASRPSSECSPPSRERKPDMHQGPAAG
jgi:adenine-specific DNA methylase